MTTALYKNFARSTLAAGINAGDGTLTVATGDGALFPSPISGESFWLVLENGSTREVAKCTSRAGDVLTITRAQQSTAAAAFALGSVVELRLTADDLTPGYGIAYAMANGYIFP